MQVLKDTWPTIGDNAMATFVGTRFVEVIAAYCAANALLAKMCDECLSGKQLGLALMFTMFLPLMGYHTFVHKVGPPG